MRSLQIPIEQLTTDQSRNDNDDERGEKKSTKLEDEEKTPPNETTLSDRKGESLNDERGGGRGREDETRERDQERSYHTLDQPVIHDGRKGRDHLRRGMAEQKIHNETLSTVMHQVYRFDRYVRTGRERV
jgi:hypothetical protein